MSLLQPSLLDQQAPDQIRSRPCPACYLCGTTGEPVYENLKDRLYSAPGTWNLKRCPNSGCGLLWLDPMPVEEDIAKAYNDYFTHTEMDGARKSWPRRAYGLAKKGYWARKYGYSEDSLGRWQKLLSMVIQLHPGRRAELDFSVMYLPSHRNGQLLDIGCGNGQALQSMADLGWQVKGVDFDPKAVQIAQKKGLEVRLGKVADQDYPSDLFDAITMSHVIEHVYDPLSLLSECRRILKPGGHLVVVTPNSGSWGHQRFRANWMHLDPPRHLHVFNEQSLSRLMENASFRVVSRCTTIRGTDGLFVGSRSIKRTGRHLMGEQSHHGRLRLFWGRGMQFAEWTILKLRPGLGEEVALVGARDLVVE
jgi:2-polyprenyl-3-methyl-5-hydroxy-6-metoxy-1,4-benzoquinol methylase